MGTITPISVGVHHHRLARWYQQPQEALEFLMNGPPRWPNYNKSNNEHLDHLCAIFIALRDARLFGNIEKSTFGTDRVSFLGYVVTIDVTYVALQAHKIVNVALHWEYSLGIVFIFSQGRKDLYHV
jgi:hypothetical protein